MEGERALPDWCVQIVSGFIPQSADPLERGFPSSRLLPIAIGASPFKMLCGILVPRSQTGDQVTSLLSSHKSIIELRQNNRKWAEAGDANSAHGEVGLGTSCTGLLIPPREKAHRDGGVIRSNAESCSQAAAGSYQCLHGSESDWREPMFPTAHYAPVQMTGRSLGRAT